MSQTRDLHQRRGFFAALLDSIERVGNRLPDQTTIFVMLAALVALGSWVLTAINFTVTHPVTGTTVAAFNLLSRDGFQWMLTNVTTNFTGFAPLGTVLVVMIGVAIAERTGLFAAALKWMVISVPRGLVTPMLIFAGMMSHIAADAGFVILPPLAAMLFVGLGRHPLAGVAAAFAGVGGGFSATLLLTSLDPLLAGLTQDAARLLDPKYEVSALANSFFLAASVIVLTLVGWFVSDRIVEPRLGPWRPAASNAGDHSAALADFSPPTPGEKRGMIVAGITFLAAIAVIILLSAPQNALLRDKTTHGLKPFFDSLVGLIALAFLLPGIVYGLVTRQLRSDKDAARMMSQTMSTMGTYIVLAFFAGQFMFWFRQSNIGLMIAIEGAAALKAVGLTDWPLMISFVVAVAIFNLLISSASAKWTILGPIFVPMMMLLGLSPEATQALYRVGDSVTNIVTPLNFYIPIILAAVTRFAPDTRIGALIAAMTPYSLAFLVVWLLMLLVWMWLGIPLGPGAPLTYQPG